MNKVLERAASRRAHPHRALLDHIEHVATATKRRWADAWRRAMKQGTTAYAAAIVTVAAEDIEALRAAWRTVSAAGVRREVLAGAVHAEWDETTEAVVVEDLTVIGPRPGPSSDERPENILARNLDFVRENHVLAVGDDDLQETKIRSVEIAFDEWNAVRNWRGKRARELQEMAMQNLWEALQAARSRFDAEYDVMRGRERIVERFRDTSVDGDPWQLITEDVHSNERTPQNESEPMRHDDVTWEPTFRLRKQRTVTLPPETVDLADPLSDGVAQAWARAMRAELSLHLTARGMRRWEEEGVIDYEEMDQERSWPEPPDETREEEKRRIMSAMHLIRVEHDPERRNFWQQRTPRRQIKRVVHAPVIEQAE